MEDDELGLYLGGHLGVIDARALQAGLSAILKLLGTPPGGGAAENVWALSALQAGSAAVAVRPGGAVTQESTDRFRDIVRGIGQLDRRAGEPDGWSPIDIEHLLELRRITGMAGVESASLWLNDPDRQVDLRGPVLNNAAASIAERTISIGSVRGHLNVYDGRKKRPRVALTDEATGRSIRITFPPEKRVDVIPYIERDVMVWGELRRNAEGRVLSVSAEGIEALKRRPAEPVRNLRGLFGPEWTAGLDSDAFVDEQRRG
ncbi:hypothetical protein [Blastococcus sp. SYSU DS1021]